MGVQFIKTRHQGLRPKQEHKQAERIYSTFWHRTFWTVYYNKFKIAHRIIQNAVTLYWNLPLSVSTNHGHSQDNDLNIVEGTEGFTLLDTVILNYDKKFMEMKKSPLYQNIKTIIILA